MAINPNTPWRELGNTDRESFKAALHRTIGDPSPMEKEANAIYDVLQAKGLTRLAAAMAWIERKNDTYKGYYPQSYHNAWAVKKFDGSGNFRQYGSYADAARDWQNVLFNSTLTDTTTLGELISVYAPSSDGNDPTAYGKTAAKEINALPLTGVPTDGGGTQPEYTFGMPPWPKGFERRILDLAPNGQGWDDLGSRTAGMCLTVCHHTAGRDNRDSVYNLFSRGGGRWGQAATDAVVDRNGLGYLMLDPWTKGQGANVTPWASGPASDLKGIGVAIVQNLGVSAVNKRGFSTEHCNVSGQGYTDKQVDLSAKVYAVVITRMKIPWDKWPNNPNVGLRIDAVHNRFAPTECPGTDWPWDGDFHRRWLQAVAHEAKILQTGSAPPGPTPIPDPEPTPAPTTFTKFGFSLEQISNAFGTMTRYNPDGTTVELTFNPAGVLSTLWLDRFGDTGILPEAEEMRQYDSQLAPGNEWYATWEGGYTAWLPVDNNRAAWRWLDSAEDAATKKQLGRP